MRKWLTISAFSLAVLLAARMTNIGGSLRDMYSRPSGNWPSPDIDTDIQWTELGQLPPGPFAPYPDSLQHMIKLGKILFFEPRLSGSGKISCASCHLPELSWTDGAVKSSGHEGTVNKRNSPSLQNVWFYKKLFWDGRAKDLADQAFAPINSESEMHSDMRELPGKLRTIKAYATLFDSAFGDPHIEPDRIAQALATFQQTITSRRSVFDEFLAGDKQALNTNELRGLHLFRTKAGCMNCHHGPLFSDNLFHNNGFAGDDKGLYQVTHNEEDMGRFKTPSLRDVMKTGPWMHDGSQNNMEKILDTYNKGVSQPGKDKLLRPLKLNKKERRALLAFLNAISAEPLPFEKPVLPE